MPYLDLYTNPLTAQTAAHLLRRATFGPRPQEIINFTGLSANNAVNQLISNSNAGDIRPPGRVPNGNDKVLIQTEHKVSINAGETAICKFITICGGFDTAPGVVFKTTGS